MTKSGQSAPSRPTVTAAACVVCSGDVLEPHLAVAGEIGREGLVPTTTRYGAALGDIWRCVRCGHMQLHPMPEGSVLAGAYAEAASEDYVEEECGQRETARRTLDSIERHARRRADLVDLGCWVGFLVAEANARGWRAIGVEPSEFASAYARDRLGVDVITTELLSAELPDSSFAAITMGDVIEHLVDPSRALLRIRQWLAEDGLLWLALPDAGSRVARLLGRRWWSVIPTHVQYFTRASIARLLERHGFEVLEIRTAPKVFSVSYYLGRIGGYSPTAARALTGAATAVSLADRLWAPDFRDRMSVLARRAD